MSESIIIVHNIRSTHNVGSLLRTAEGMGVARVILTGYTPYPLLGQDTRLPHIAHKLTAQIHKTALGAEALVPIEYHPELEPVLRQLRDDKYRIVGLEQDERSTALPKYQAPARFALLLGEEVDGIAPEFRDACDDLIEIPMYGKKESFNVSVAAGIALYALLQGNPPQ